MKTFLFTTTLSLLVAVPSATAQSPAPSKSTKESNPLDGVARGLGLNMVPNRRPPPPPSERPLGWLSEWHEVRRRGPGAVSPGTGDVGGPSYGLYQLTSSAEEGMKSNVERFIDEYYPKEFEGLKVNSEAFKAKWKELARTKPEEFRANQHSYVKRTHYDPLVGVLQVDLGLTPDAQSATLRNVVWSTAVQHGPEGGAVVFKKALAPLLRDRSISALDDEEVVKAVYAERGRVNADGSLAYFGKNSRQVQESVAKRFPSELADALSALAAERTSTRRKLLDAAKKSQDEMKRRLRDQDKSRSHLSPAP